jgi:hypothetical protein
MADFLGKPFMGPPAVSALDPTLPPRPPRCRRSPARRRLSSTLLALLTLLPPPQVPHSGEEFFKVYFFGAHLAIALASFPGRVLGSEVRPRRYNRDYILSVCDEAAQRRQAARGKVPTTWFKGAPRAGDQSWQRVWHDHLVWRSWRQERMGPYYSPI